MASTTSSTDQRPESAQPGDGVEITAPRARQAYPGRRILWILLASLAAVVLAFFVAFATNNTTPVADKRGNGSVTDPATIRTFNAPEPAPKQPG